MDEPCKRCGVRISKYHLEKKFGNIYKDYEIHMCWACGYFNIKTDELDELTMAIHSNPALIYEMLEQKILKPIS